MGRFQFVEGVLTQIGGHFASGVDTDSVVGKNDVAGALISSPKLLERNIGTVAGRVSRGHVAMGAVPLDIDRLVGAGEITGDMAGKAAGAVVVGALFVRDLHVGIMAGGAGHGAAAGLKALRFLHQIAMLLHHVEPLALVVQAAKLEADCVIGERFSRPVREGFPARHDDSGCHAVDVGLQVALVTEVSLSLLRIQPGVVNRLLDLFLGSFLQDQADMFAARSVTTLATDAGGKGVRENRPRPRTFAG